MKDGNMKLVDSECRNAQPSHPPSTARELTSSCRLVVSLVVSSSVSFVFIDLHLQPHLRNRVI